MLILRLDAERSRRSRSMTWVRCRPSILAVADVPVRGVSVVD
jgi:hypothetical protein